MTFKILQKEFVINEYFKCSTDHLLDEFNRISLLLKISVKKFKQKTRRQGEIFETFFISDEDADRLSDELTENDQHGCEEEIESIRDRIDKLEVQISLKKNNSNSRRIFLSLVALQNIFGLSRPETDIIVLCTLPEIDRRYERLLGYLQDDLTLKRPTIGLIVRLFSDTRRGELETVRYFLEENKLTKYDLVKIGKQEEHSSLSANMLKLDQRILHYLLESKELDDSISAFTVLLLNRPPGFVPSGHIKDNLLRLLNDKLQADAEGKKFFINLGGSDEDGREALIATVCHEVNLPLLTVDLSELLKTEIEPETAIKKIFREGILLPAALYFKNAKSMFTGGEKEQGIKKVFFRVAAEFSWITFFGVEVAMLVKQKTMQEHVFLNFDLPLPRIAERKRIWSSLLAGEGLELGEKAINSLAGMYKFTEGQITAAISNARNLRGTGDGTGGEPYNLLHEGCRIEQDHNLTALAQRVKSSFTWADLVLPVSKKMQLEEIAQFIAHHDVVFNTWGFEKKLALGKGLNILFSGPSGTGKTMAASVLANEFGFELYKIDLSSVVSKYIGETEKNLAKLFKEAEAAAAILFFDEADALFGKRSEVKDAHDRYANIEINYLLQKMEEHEGIVVLATNLSRNLDEAFLRRMHFIVEFPFPEAEQREMIWRNIFPAETPLADDIDFSFLSEKVRLVGGNIKNIALASAFYAAEESAAVGMRHLIRAVGREYHKTGKPFLKTDFDPHYQPVGEE